ncbi:MAG: RDD family protein [Solirubrobacteraceae bacterium]|nr:RDD family protein [Solirubrobacteraceae bacterium]
MSINPFAPPTTEVADIEVAPQEVRYVGFWVRVVAALVDTLLVLAITMPLLVTIYGWAYFDDGKPVIAGPADALLSWGLPALASIVFWLTKQATPGKMLFSAAIVDAKTGGKLSTGQAIGRYLGYFVSLLPLGLGILWVAFDARKQGWHDKLAGTVVVRR